VKHEIYGQRTKVEERCDEAPILFLAPDRLQTEEELEWGDEVTLTGDGGEDGGRGPPTGTDWNFVKPCF